MSAIWEMQKAIYDILIADAPLMSLIGTRIYDEPLPNIKYPYLVLSNFVELSNNTHDGVGYETTFDIDIYDKIDSIGSARINAIYIRLNELLNLKKPTLSISEGLYSNTGTASYPSSISTLTCLIIKLDNTTTDRDENHRILLTRYRIFSEIN